MKFEGQPLVPTSGESRRSWVRGAETPTKKNTGGDHTNLTLVYSLFLAFEQGILLYLRNLSVKIAIWIPIAGVS